MRIKLLSLLLVLCLAPAAFAQAAQSFSTAVGSNAFMNAVTTFEVTASADLVIHNVGVGFYQTGNAMVEVWYRPDGIGAVAPAAMPLTNWVYAGIQEVEVNTPNDIHQIPLALNLVLSANEKVGFCLVRTNGMLSQYLSGATIHQNSHMTIDATSYAGSYSAAASPSFNSYYPSSRVANVSVWYDAGPTVAPSVPSVALPSASLGTASQVVSYEVRGFQLSSATTITAPQNVEISFSPNSGFTTQLMINGHPDYPATTVYVRSKTTAPVGPVTGNITHVSPGAPNRSVSVSGNVISMSTTTSSIDLGWTTINQAGSPKSFVLQGSNLTSNTLITAPNGFQVATNINGPFVPSVTLTAPTYNSSIYVRLDGEFLGVKQGSVISSSGPGTVHVAVSGEVLPPYNLLGVRNGPTATAWADNNHQGDGLVVLDFTLRTFAEGWTVQDVTLAATGTANADTAFDFLALYEDLSVPGGHGQFDLATDILAAPVGISFNGGAFTAALNNADFPPYTQRRFFLVGKLAGTASVDQTIGAELVSVNASTQGTGFVAGIPTSGGTAITINPSVITADLNGPLAYTTVLADSQGPMGQGHLLHDMTVTASNDSWTVSEIVFRDAGTINGATAFSSLALYVDNGNGTWDGAGIDTLATAQAGTAFNTPNGTYTAVLTQEAGAFEVSESKRFFLVATLSGAATPAQTARVALESMNHSAPGGGEAILTRTPSSALVVNMAALTIGAGPFNPGATSVASKAEGFTHVAGQFRLSSSINTFTVDGLQISTGGSGDWETDIASVSIYRDNGNGVFGPGDTELFTGPGASPGITAIFSSALVVPPNGHVDIWVILSVNPDVGANPAATFEAEVANGSDIIAGGNVNLAIGSLPPKIGDLRVVDFAVDSFSPGKAGREGGAPITITGSGFALPVSLSIGGIPADGVAQVNAAGTEITGLFVPEGAGKGLEVVLETNELAPVTLEQSFSYSSGYAGDAPVTGGCVAGVPVTPLAAMVPAMLALVSLRRRRK